MSIRIGWPHVLIALLSAIAASLATFAVVGTLALQSPQATQQGSAPPASRVANRDGLTVVTIDPAARKESGIEVSALTAATRRVETVAYGSVMDLQPLVDLRARYAAAVADVEASEANVAAASAEYRRLRALYEDDRNASLKAYQAAQATYRSDAARAVAAKRAVENVRASLRQQWGGTLEQWVVAGDSPRLQRLLKREEILVRITLAPDSRGKAPASIQIAAADNERHRARLVSRSPRTDPALQGNAYLYRSAAALAAGTGVVAYLPASGTAMKGTAIPASAIVWYGGRPWIYVETAPQQFARRPVPEPFPGAGGYFVAEGIRPGERAVVSGAGLLLSEELRPPANSSSCSDPECD